MTLPLLKLQETCGRHMPPVLTSDAWLIREEPPPCQRVPFLLLASREPSRLAFPAISVKLCFPVPFSKWKSYFLFALSNVQNTAFTFLTGSNCSGSFALLAQMSSAFCFWVSVLSGYPLLTKKPTSQQKDSALAWEGSVWIEKDNYTLLRSLALFHMSQEIRHWVEAATMNCWYYHYLYGPENKQPLQITVLLVCEPWSPMGLGSCLCSLPALQFPVPLP